MQDRYVGDFAKYGLLRALGHGKRLGTAWYKRTDPDQGNSNDGKYIGYLDRPDE